MASSLSKKMDISQAREALKAKQGSAKAYQEANTEMVRGVRLRPAIGKTGGVDNVGWEMHKKGSEDWYVTTKEEALSKLDRFLAF